MSQPRPPESPEERRRKRIATAGSIAVHALLAVLFGALLRMLLVTPHEQISSSTEIVTIARKTPEPKVRTHPRPRAAPRPPVAVVPPPRAAAPLHPTIVVPHVTQLSKPSHKIAPEPRHAAPPVAAPVTSAPPVVAHGASPAHEIPGKARLSSAQIASIQSDLASAISEDKANAPDPLHVDHPDALETPKDYGASYGSFGDIGDARRGHGVCDPESSWQDHGFDYYYVACEVKLSDGTQRRDNVPWPVRFPPNDNPFLGTSKGTVPLAMPLPDWHETAGTEIPEELRQYAKDHGVTL